MATITSIESQRVKRQLEMRTPYLPEDLVHYEDGSWECSSDSLAKMQRSFGLFGVAVRPQESFDTLYEDLTFILKATSLLPRLGYGNIEKVCPLELIEYLQALRTGDRGTIAKTVEAARLSHEPG